MICFADNDVLLKVAACDLLEEMLAVLGVDRTRVRVLPTAASYLKANQRIRLKHSAEQIGRALAFVSSVSVINEAPDRDELRILKDTDGIDDGELILFASTRGYSWFTILTDDKRSLQALAAAPSCSAIVRRLKGNVLCFDQLLISIFARYGYAAVVPRVAAASSCDGNLQKLFTAGVNTPEDFATGQLRMQVATLRSAAPGLLVV